jgi:dUTP pyrophosphatase
MGVKMSKIQVKIVNDMISLPERATDGSAGFDLLAAIDETLVLQPGESKLIPTGLAIFIKDPSVVGLILPRSKRGHKDGLVVGNLTGVIDSDYQGQWFVSAWNRNSNKTVTIDPYSAIAQTVFLQLAKVDFEQVEEFPETTERSDGGISKDVDTRG